MSLEKQLLDVEKRRWKNDAELYHDNLTDEALLVFPETGVITRDVAVEAILGRSIQLTQDVALLTYRVNARWEDEESEHPAFASSVYGRRQGAWKLAFHQQSPLGAG